MSQNSHQEKKKKTRPLLGESAKKPRTFTQLLVSVGGFVLGSKIARQKPQRKRKQLYEWTGQVSEEGM